MILDPASCVEANETVQAARFYTVQDDGLAQRWKGRVWLNPPYGRLAGAFVAKVDEHYRAGDVSAAIVLVNSSTTETAWFRPLWRYSLCFVRGRIDFETAGREKRSTATHGSVIAYLGPESVPVQATVRRVRQHHRGRVVKARTCGHGRDWRAPCPACAIRVNPRDYWELRRLAVARDQARRRKRGVQ